MMRGEAALARGGDGGEEGQRGELPPQAKQRKAYQLSKQRERWTADEHARFVEALKQWGRQWGRIQGEFFFRDGSKRQS